jgi:hypothetical protein
MSQSETIGALVTALVAASGEFDAATKSATNPHFRSKYADLDTVVSATAPALRKHGLAIIQRFTVDDTLQTILVHSSGEWISGEQRLHAAKLDPQGIGLQKLAAGASCSCLQGAGAVAVDNAVCRKRCRPSTALSHRNSRGQPA